VVRLLGGLAITVMALYCSPHGRTGRGRGREGSGLYPELAAYRISEGNSPNVQAEVGRLVGLLPIALMAVLFHMEPAAMYPLLHSWYGWATLGFIATMEFVGAIIIRKIVSIDV